MQARILSATALLCLLQLSSATPCSSSSPCADSSMYCQFSAGTSCSQSNSAIGTCVSKPQACMEIYSPVCGCNGVTYTNECDALTNGALVNVNSNNANNCTNELAAPCLPVACLVDPCSTATCSNYPQATCRADYCGGCNAKFYVDNTLVDCSTPPPSCLSNSDCKSNQFCQKSSCSGSGTCQSKPEMCTLIYHSVCSCNGAVYGNECSAFAAGESIDATRNGDCTLKVSAAMGGKGFDLNLGMLVAIMGMLTVFLGFNY